jgi:Holliday junction resolvasome RuvABC DNA-binding subunit
MKLLDKTFEDGDYEKLYKQSRVDEKEAKDMLIEFEEQYPNELKTENIDTILEQMKRKRDEK